MSPQRIYDDESPVSDYRRSVADHDSSADREISLSTPTILGLFFALAIVCACFFGLGYAMGRKSLPTATPALMDNATAPGNGAIKPTAGSTAPPPAAATPDSSPAAAQPAQTLTVPLTNSAVPTAPAANPAAAAAQTAASAASAAAPSSFVVQVAAVSSQDVADILLSSLQKKGYAVAVHPSPQDKLLHVQIGPFADRGAAEAMRQRVLADGFNAIVK